MLCLCVFMVTGQRGWVVFHQEKHMGQCPLQKPDHLLFQMPSVPWLCLCPCLCPRVLQTGCLPGMGWWLETNPGLSASALLGWLFSLHWDRVYCSFFFSSEQAVCLFSCAQHHDSVGSSMASSMLPSPGVEGPWC